MTNPISPAHQVTSKQKIPKKLAGVRVAGRMSHHQTNPVAAQLAALDIAFHGDLSTESRLGKPAPAWSLAWRSGYRVYNHRRTRQLAALILPEQLLRVRPITPKTGEAGS